eukprot:COSAG05_NODE_3029_length_2405_cov_18.605831_3_plen_78_part_00
MHAKVWFAASCHPAHSALRPVGVRVRVCAALGTTGTSFVKASASANTLAMQAMRAKMTGDTSKYREIIERIHRGEGT